MYDSYNIFRIVFVIVAMLGVATVCSLQLVKAYKIRRDGTDILERSFKKKVLTAIALASLGFMLLVPVFTFAKLDLLGSLKLSGYSFVFSGEELEDFIRLDDSLMSVSIIALLFVVLHIVGAFVGFSTLIKAYLIEEEAVFDKNLIKKASSATILSFLYFIFDLIVCGYIESEGGSWIEASSYTFIPFILSCFLIGGFIAVKFLMPEEFEFSGFKFNFNIKLPKKSSSIESEEQIPKARPQKAYFPQDDKFVEIRKYKALLDEDIITKEEFNIKKYEILDIKPTNAVDTSQETT